jgi:hypothetical protein
MAAGQRPALADHDDISSKRMYFAERGGNLVVSTPFTTELFDIRDYENLAKGFVTTVVARIYVYRKDRDEPVSAVMVSFRVVYDLWDRQYVVRIEGPRGRQTYHYNHQADALKALTTLDAMPVAPLADIPPGPHHYLAMVLELNPVSKELQAEMRRWLTRPAGSASIDRSSSFFGSFVSVFVNPRLPEADRVVRLRSQPFYRVPP